MNPGSRPSCHNINDSLHQSKENFKEKDNLIAGPRWVPDTKIDWPTDCRS
jgi:hypothetical protein